MLKALREQKGLSQDELAKLAKLTKPYISQIENGVRTNPSPAALTRLAKALRVPRADLLAQTMLPREWWRPEKERELSDVSQLRSGEPFFIRRKEAEESARRLGYPFVARYQDKPGGFIWRAFPVRSEK